MAGRKIFRTHQATILERVEWIADEVAKGRTFKSVAQELGINYTTFMKVLATDKVRPVMADARKARATVLMDETLAIADEVEPERDQIQKAKLRIETRQALARADDPERYAPERSAGVTVNVNVGELHLDALRAARVPQGRVIEHG